MWVGEGLLGLTPSTGFSLSQNIKHSYETFRKLKWGKANKESLLIYMEIFEHAQAPKVAPFGFF